MIIVGEIMMAITQLKVDIDDENKRGPTKCPKCSEKVLIIDGTFIKWLTCPKCKYKKLISNKDKPPIKVTSLMDQ